MKKIKDKLMTYKNDKDDSAAEAAADWVLKMDSTGEAEILQSAEFRSWLALNETHEKTFQEVRDLWGELDEVGSCLGKDKSGRLWARFGSGKRLAVAATALAASLLLLFVAVPQFQAIRFPGADQTTNVGEIREFTLSDGSRVILDTGSAINISFSDHVRHIDLLAGRASFQVAADHDRPFEVRSGDITATALGTVYSVRRMEDGERVAVSESKVKINDGTVVRAGMAFQSHAGSPPTLGSADMTRENAWERGKIIFENTPLRAVVEEINRYHSGWILLPDDGIANMKVNGVFDLSDTGRVVDVLAASLDLKSRRMTGHFIVLYKKN